MVQQFILRPDSDGVMRPQLLDESSETVRVAREALAASLASDLQAPVPALLVHSIAPMPVVPRVPKAGLCRVYVAGPLGSSGHMISNIREAIGAAEILRTAGFTPFVPHLFAFWHFAKPRPEAEWLAFDLEWLAACHAVLRLKGHSKGADVEEAEAARLGIPVFHELRDLWQWRVAQDESAKCAWQVGEV